MIKFRLVLILLGVGVLLMSCGTTSDFVRSEGSARDYNRDFANGTWEYADYLVSRTSGFESVHESIAVQAARSGSGERVFSLAYQTYSHRDQRDNDIVVFIDGDRFVLTDVEPDRSTLFAHNDVIERNTVVLSSDIVGAMLNADSVVFEYGTTVEVSGRDLQSLQDFISTYHVATL